MLGHILPMVGRDWAQLGVAQLFSKIADNGYKLLYLSARAIGQSRVNTSNKHKLIRRGQKSAVKSNEYFCKLNAVVQTGDARILALDSPGRRETARRSFVAESNVSHLGIPSRGD